MKCRRDLCIQLAASSTVDFYSAAIFHVSIASDDCKMRGKGSYSPLQTLTHVQYIGHTHDQNTCQKGREITTFFEIWTWGQVSVLHTDFQLLNKCLSSRFPPNNRHNVGRVYPPVSRHPVQHLVGQPWELGTCCDLRDPSPSPSHVQCLLPDHAHPWTPGEYCLYSSCIHQHTHTH